MPTKLPRLQITISDHVRDSLNALSDAVDKPAASIVAQLLEEMVPQLDGLTKIARASKAGNKAAAKRALVHMMGQGMADVLSSHQRELELASKGKK